MYNRQKFISYQEINAYVLSIKYSVPQDFILGPLPLIMQ